MTTDRLEEIKAWWHLRIARPKTVEDIQWLIQEVERPRGERPATFGQPQPDTGMTPHEINELASRQMKNR